MDGSMSYAHGIFPVHCHQRQRLISIRGEVVIRRVLSSLGTVRYQVHPPRSPSVVDLPFFLPSLFGKLCVIGYGQICRKIRGLGCVNQGRESRNLAHIFSCISVYTRLTSEASSPLLLRKAFGMETKVRAGISAVPSLGDTDVRHFYTILGTERCKIIPACSKFRGSVSASHPLSATACQSAIFREIGGNYCNLAGTFLHNSVQ